MLLPALGWIEGQTSAAEFPTGTVIPRVTCVNDANQSYALYLPTKFAPKQAWPVIYVFDPFAQGDSAAKVVQAAAEKFGYIVVASNNSKNGPMGGSREAAAAIWKDTHERLPIDPKRQYFGGLSGGARVATSLAINCQCAAGVIANAAGFPISQGPSASSQFAYFATVGNADFNYTEFAQLRPKLDSSGMHYVIRVFDGPHGWAPADVWLEALEWLDIQAMMTGSLTRDPLRIQAVVDFTEARATKFEADNDLLAAYREYQAIVRNFAGLTQVGTAQARISELRKNKALKAAEKREAAELDMQERLEAGPSDKMAALSNGEMDEMAFRELKSSLADLKRQAASDDRDSSIRRRALSGLVVQAYESGQNSMDTKNYSMALQYFDLAASGSANPTWAYYQRARIYAIRSERKNMLAEIRKCIAAGIHNPSALDVDEFRRYSEDREFQSLAEEWRMRAVP
jgi:hypothetical protein